MPYRPGWGTGFARACARADIQERRRSNERYPRQAGGHRHLRPFQHEASRQGGPVRPGSIEWVVIVVCIAVALIAALVYLSNQMNIKLNIVSKTLAGTNVNGANTPS